MSAGQSIHTPNIPVNYSRGRYGSLAKLIQRHLLTSSSGEHKRPASVRSGAGGPSCLLTPQIGHKLGLCVFSELRGGGTTWTELTSDNRAHAGVSVSHYSVLSADVLYHKTMLYHRMMKPSTYLLLKMQQNPDMACSETSLPLSYSPSGISSQPSCKHNDPAEMSEMCFFHHTFYCASQSLDIHFCKRRHTLDTGELQ